MAPDSRIRSFLRSKLFWAAISILATVLVTLSCTWILRQSSLDSQLASLRAEGLPTTASEINEFYTVPEGVADTTELWDAAIDAVQAARISERGTILPIIGEGPIPVPVPGEAWAELEASRTLLTKLETELQTVWRAAAAGGQVRFPVDFSSAANLPFFSIQATRGVAWLLSLDAHVSAHDGDYARALRDLMSIFALSDALRGEPCLISQLVRRSFHAIGSYDVERLLPHCQWSDAELNSLQSAIRPARFKDELNNALCGERAFCLSVLDDMTLGPFRQANNLEALRFFEGSIEALSGSWLDAIRRQREIDTEFTQLEGGKLARIRLMGVLKLLSALEQAAIAGARATARQRCAIAAIAARRYRLKHGRLPSLLAEIDARLLGDSTASSAQLTDPFNGQPLLYKMEETRVVIYSVGENEQDDGGHCGLQQQRPLDVGFSLKR